MSLTPEVELRKQQFIEAKQKYHDLFADCRHHVDGKSKADCNCAICGEHVGWHCSLSPDGVCHFASQEGFVELIDKNLTPIPVGHDANKEREGWCLFCQQHVDNREGSFSCCARCDRQQILRMDSGYWCGWCNDWALETSGDRVEISESPARERPPLTNEQEEYKRQLTDAAKHYYGLLRECKHVAHVTYGSCVICGKNLGWLCPASPDRVCHYFSDNGYVEMVDQSQVPVPSRHDDSNESPEWCIFCGEPSERK